MTQNRNSGPRVPTERPDPEAAERDPGPGAQDRPGFDLGGAVDPSNTDAGGRATGLTDPSGSRSLGNEGDAGSDSGSGPTDGSGGPT
jgi:hypothetical protein